MTLLPYRDHTFARFLSTRTGETLLEIKMLGGAMIIWGSHYRPSEFDARLDGDTVTLTGSLRDRIGPVADQRRWWDLSGLVVGRNAESAIALQV